MVPYKKVRRTKASATTGFIALRTLNFGAWAVFLVSAVSFSSAGILVRLGVGGRSMLLDGNWGRLCWRRGCLMERIVARDGLADLIWSDLCAAKDQITIYVR